MELLVQQFFIFGIYEHVIGLKHICRHLLITAFHSYTVAQRFGF